MKARPQISRGDFLSNASYYIVIWHLTWNFPRYKKLQKNAINSQTGIFHVRCQITYNKWHLTLNFPNFKKMPKRAKISIRFLKPSIGEILCQMPEAYTWHEISPLLQTNIHIADQLGKFHVRCCQKHYLRH